jgi:hypothetical protein
VLDRKSGRTRRSFWNSGGYIAGGHRRIEDVDARKCMWGRDGEASRASHAALGKLD